MTDSSNVEIVRRALAAAMRRPKPDFAVMNDVYHPDHELTTRVDAIEGGRHRGARGFREWMANAEETLPWESTVEKVTALDEDRVLAIIPTRNEGKSSGIAFDERLACIVTVRDGKIVRTEVFLSPEEALEAASLRQ